MENKKYEYIVRSCDLGYGDLTGLKTLEKFLKNYSEQGWKVILLTRVSSTFYEVVFERVVDIALEK